MMNMKNRHRQVARLHIFCINQGFLPELGETFLALMYRAIDESPEGILLMDTDGAEVTGFVSGALSMKPIYRTMLRHWPTLALALLPSLVRPRKVWRIFEILRYGGMAEAGVPVPDAELLSIAVAPAYRGKGRADNLYGRLINAFRTHGVSAFKITVGEALVPAHKFYRRMGVVPVTKTQVHSGEVSLVYVQHTASGNGNQQGEPGLPGIS